MNKEIKEKWVAALRSGEYKQGKSALKETQDGKDAFCCYGVLCDLAVAAGVAEATRFEDNRTTQYNDQAGSLSSFYLPDGVTRWAGLAIRNHVIIDGIREDLADHNDHGKTFEQIADAIEEQL